jgi:hypothetical protein
LDFDDLLIDIVSQPLIHFRRHGRSGEAHERGERKQESTKHGAYYDMGGAGQSRPASALAKSH